MNYRDAELLNSSIDKIGESLLRNRIMDQQQQQQADANSFRDKQLNMEQQKIDATNRNTAAATADRAKANIHRTWSDQIKMIGGWVKDGIVDPDVAQQKMQMAYSQMPPDQKAALEDHPAVQAILNNEPIWEKPSKPAPELTPSKIGNRDVMIGPGGSVHYVDEFSPADKLEVQDLNSKLKDIDVETRSLAKEPDAAKARALISQRERYESRKNAILSRYKSGSSADDDTPAAHSADTTPTKPKQDLAALRAEAQAAITAGKDPAAVKARFKSMTGEDL